MNWSGRPAVRLSQGQSRLLIPRKSCTPRYQIISEIRRHCVPGHNYPIVTHVKLEFKIKKIMAINSFFGIQTSFMFFFLRRVGQLLQNKTSSRTTNENTAKRNHDSD